MRVRRTLSESEIERHARLDQRFFVTHSLVVQIVSIPIAISLKLALRIIGVCGETETPTERGKVHEAGEGDSPEVHGENYVATVDLGVGGGIRCWTLRRMCVALNEELTRRPSASQLFERNISLGVMESAPDQMDNGYPVGPGGIMPSTPRDSRLSTYERDSAWRAIPVSTVANENMATV